jgi:hypothetical protein
MGISGYCIDSDLFLSWTVKVHHLIASVCGEKSQHLAQLLESEKRGLYTTNYDVFKKTLAVLLVPLNHQHKIRSPFVGFFPLVPTLISWPSNLSKKSASAINPVELALCQQRW